VDRCFDLAQTSGADLKVGAIFEGIAELQLAHLLREERAWMS
jgi:hypothetical protein